MTKIIKYYDKSYKVWVAYLVDEFENQLGDCEYAPSKKLLEIYIQQRWSFIGESEK